MITDTHIDSTRDFGDMCGIGIYMRTYVTNIDTFSDNGTHLQFPRRN